MTKKRFQIENFHDFCIIVEVDEEKMAERETLEEINSFFGGAKERVSAHGSVLKAVLVQLHRLVFWLVVEAGGHLSIDELKQRFSGELACQEGWPDMDGSWGIELIEASEFECNDELTFTEVA